MLPLFIGYGMLVTKRNQFWAMHMKIELDLIWNQTCLGFPFKEPRIWGIWKCEKTKFATGPEVLANQKKILELEFEVISKF